MMALITEGAPQEADRRAGPVRDWKGAEIVCGRAV